MNPGSNSEPKDNYFHMDHCDVSSFRRSPLGIPSLPDFVQDHLLLEQTYLGSNGPLTVDFDNLPDFTLNSNYDNAQCSTDQSSGSGARRIASCKSVPLDLPSFIEERAESNQRAEGRCRPSPLDLPNNLSLDLTDSLNHLNLKRRDNQSRIPFPLDLPGNDNSTSGGSTNYHVSIYTTATRRDDASAHLSYKLEVVCVTSDKRGSWNAFNNCILP